LPFGTQGTTEESTRFEARLAKQVALFGSGMEKVQTDGPVLRRNVNRWLADNCPEELLSFTLQMAAETDGALEWTIYPVLSAWRCGQRLCR